MDKGLEIIGRVLREASAAGNVSVDEMETATQWLIDHNHEHPHEND